MESEMLRCITSGLRRFDLTEAEAEWLHFAESNLDRNNPLSRMMGLTLERIYGQKTAVIRDSILCLLEPAAPLSSPCVPHPFGASHCVKTVE